MSDIVERAKAALEGVTEGPWVFDPDRDDYLVSESTGEVVGSQRFNTEFIAAARTLVPELVAEVERLRRSEWAARGERDSMKRRLELLSADESWWVGGVWGDYGEVVVPVRAIAMVLGEKMVDQKKPGEPEIDPGLAATYRDLRATVEHLASENERLQAALSEAKP